MPLALLYVLLGLSVILLFVVAYDANGLWGVPIAVGIVLAGYLLIFSPPAQRRRAKVEEAQIRREVEKLERKARERREKLEQQASRER